MPKKTPPPKWTKVSEVFRTSDPNGLEIVIAENFLTMIFIYQGTKHRFHFHRQKGWSVSKQVSWREGDYERLTPADGTEVFEDAIQLVRELVPTLPVDEKLLKPWLDRLLWLRV